MEVTMPCGKWLVTVVVVSIGAIAITAAVIEGTIAITIVGRAF